MSNDNFYDSQTEQSLVKTKIVAKYFDVWANVMIHTQKRYPDQPQKIGYIDLFAGPGVYKDGTPSTPIIILEKAIKNQDLRKRLVVIFNDKDPVNSKMLEKRISQIPGIDQLSFKPDVYNFEVSEEIAEIFEKVNFIPTLLFVDPWGYKGLSLKLFKSMLKDWGCDVIFFFNYNRVNMGINNSFFIEHMKALFGEEKAEELAEKVEGKTAGEREECIIEELSQALKENARYVLPFRFKKAEGVKTSHHLIFMSKHILGYTLMKEIMASQSSNECQGIASFEYNPADFLPQQTLLSQLSRPLEDLKDDLLRIFKGRTLTMQEIYEEHSVDTPYISKNYKDVLRKLYESGKIKAVSKEGKPPRKGSFGNNIIVTFPGRSDDGNK